MIQPDRFTQPPLFIPPDGCSPYFRRPRSLWYAAVVLLVSVVTVSAGIRFLAPRNDEFVTIDEFIIVIGLPEKTEKIRLFFDGNELSSVQRTAMTATFIPEEEFLGQEGIEGPHRIIAKRYGMYSDFIEEISTMVYLVRKDTLSAQERSAMIEKGKQILQAKPLRRVDAFHNGRVATWFEYDEFQDSTLVTAEADAWGNGSIGDFKYDYNFTLRTDEGNDYQTLQRFRGAVSYRSLARLSIGDNWPAYHKSILRQQRVRGFELNLATPRNFVGLDFVWGKAARSIEPFVVNESIFASCSTHNDSAAAYAPGTYERDIKALRLSFGTPLLFGASISVFKATDDAGSINQLTLIDSTINDTIFTGRRPMDNLVYGADAHLSLLRGKTQLYGSFAMSWLTRDISEGSISSREISDYFASDITLPSPEIFSRILIVNATTVPLPLPVDTTQTVNGNALMGAMNWDAGIRCNLPLPGVRYRGDFKYYFIGPNYASLGNQFLMTDRAGFLFNNEAHLWDNRLFFRAKFNWYQKDIFEITGTPTAVINSSLSGSMTLQDNLPTLTLLGSVNDETARTDHADDPGRETEFYTLGGSVVYAPHLGRVTPSLTLSYYNATTGISTSNLPEPFSMRSHIVVANITTPIDNFLLEPCVSFSMNATTGDVPLTLITVTGGSRLHIVPKVFIADLLLGFNRTVDDRSARQNDLSLKLSGRYDISERHSLWLDAGIKRHPDTKFDQRFRLNYELRY
ncbi:MAG: hypothetical protein JW863_08375 [Chitinispirillaceae bacterium]|nr:hypothetical protein [Chitinispirillaceae bacterium]